MFTCHLPNTLMINGFHFIPPSFVGVRYHRLLAACPDNRQQVCLLTKEGTGKRHPDCLLIKQFHLHDFTLLQTLQFFGDFNIAVGLDHGGERP